MTIIFIIIITSIIQSLFGVGVLLFGTPLLLLFDYTFLEILLILLPISAIINILQIIKDYKYINKKIYLKIIYITIPFIVLFLFFLSRITININFFIACLLIFISLKNHIKLFNTIFNKIIYFDKIYYIILGIIHGVTNLGGVLLTTKIFQTNLNRYEKRATIAISYFTFALFQIITIMLLDINIQYSFNHIIYILIGIGVYIISNKIFHSISDNKYNKLFLFFLFITGVLLFAKEYIRNT